MSPPRFITKVSGKRIRFSDIGQARNAKLPKYRANWLGVLKAMKVIKSPTGKQKRRKR